MTYLLRAKAIAASLMSACLVGAALLTGVPGGASAYEYDWTDLTSLMKANVVHRGSIVAETLVEVFDPFVKGAAASGQTAESAPRPLPAFGFRQTIHWSHRQFLAVETFSMTGEPLHFLLDSGTDDISVSLRLERPFAEIDVRPHFVTLMAQDAHALKRSLQRMNIDSTTVSFARNPEDEVFFRIGEKGHPHFLLVDKATYQPREWHTRLIGPDGADDSRAVRVLFKKMATFDKQRYPAEVDYLLDGALFKRVHVRKVAEVQSLPLTELANKARQYAPANAAAMSIDYMD